MKKFVLALLALFAVSNAFAKNCDVNAFLKVVEKNCPSSARYTKKINKANYCKQYSNFAVATLADEGGVVVKDKTSCVSTTYSADKSGIAELKIIGGFAYVRANDGNLYIVDAKGYLYEILSRAGNSYQGQSACTDIKGPGGKNEYAIVTLRNSSTFNLYPTDITRNGNRWELKKANRFE